MSYYLIRVGEGSKYIDEARKDGFVAVGWNKVPDLSTFGSTDEIKKAIRTAGYDYSPSQLAAQAGQLARFALDAQEGDVILSPLGRGEYLVGRIGAYFHEPKPPGSCPYVHRRAVQWLERTLHKEDMSTNLGYALGATLTIYSLDKYADELEALIAGHEFTPAEKPQRVRDVILEGLYGLDGKAFEEFIRHVLDIVGFTAETTQYSGDKGIDVNGNLDAEGLASITLRVQVKRVKQSIGSKEILSLRGTLGQGEHACFITLSSFTRQAVEEAEAPGKVPVKLIDGNDLAGVILRNFEGLDEKYQTLFAIRRKKDFDLEQQFEIYERAADIDSHDTTVEEGRKRKAPAWDTLVCAAKEDGFKRAFLGQKAWWAVRLNSTTIPHIKYVAIYQVAPVSKITYYGQVERIEPFQDSGKYIIHLKGDPVKLQNPVGLGENPHLKPQGPRYARLKNILEARTLDEVFPAQSD